LPKTVHCAELMASLGMLLVLPCTVSCVKAEVHFIPPSSQAKLPTECPCKPICFHIPKDMVVSASVCVALVSGWSELNKTSTNPATTFSVPPTRFCPWSITDGHRTAADIHARYGRSGIWQMMRFVDRPQTPDPFLISVSVVPGTNTWYLGTCTAGTSYYGYDW
jgi:hypothetical protein